MSDPKGKGDRSTDNLGFLNLGPGWVPLEWIVLVKCLNPEGNVRYREMTSKTLQPVEALGMIETMGDTIRTKIMSTARHIGEDE